MSAAGEPERATWSDCPSRPNSPPRPPKTPPPPAANAITAAQATSPMPPATRAADPMKTPCTTRMVGA
jgi:hypothetical protein